MAPKFRSSFYRRIQISFFLLFLLPTLLVTFYNYSATSRDIKEKFTLKNESLLAVMGKDLTKMIDDLTFASNFFVQDPSVKLHLKSFADVQVIDSFEKFSRYEQIKDFFSLVSAKTMTQDIIMFLTNRSDFIIQSSNTYEPDDIVQNWNTLKSRIDVNKARAIQWLGLFEGSGTQGKTFFISRVLRDFKDNELLATLVIGIPEKYFNNFFLRLKLKM